MLPWNYGNQHLKSEHGISRVEHKKPFIIRETNEKNVNI